ncbi:MAG: hypothetical protein ACPG3T_05955, partial [Pseudomonadales bacterium]
MWEETRIVIVDSDERRRQDLQLVFEFIGEPARALSYPEWLDPEVQASTDNGNLTLLVLGDDAQPLNERLALAQQWQNHLPVMLVDHVADQALDDDVMRPVISQVQMPPNYARIVDDLHRAQVYREQHSESFN